MGRKGRAVLSRRTVRTCRPGSPILPGCPRRASDADAGRVLLPAVVRPAENTGCRNRRRERCAILPRRTVRARRALCAVLSGRAVRAGVALVSLFAPCALKRPIVDPALCYAVENINVIRLRRTDAVSVARHRRLHGRFQRGGRLIIPLHEKARASLALRTLCASFPLRAAFAGVALWALCAGVALRTLCAGVALLTLRACFTLWPLRACFAFWPLCTRLAFWALRAGIALRALRAGAALLALRPHDASNIDGAAVRQREDEPSPVRDLNRLHASGDQSTDGHCDRIRNLYPHIRTSLCRRAVVPRKRCFVAVRI